MRSILPALRGALSPVRETGAAPATDLTLSRVLAWISAIFLVAVVVADVVGPTPAVSSVEPARERPAWTEVRRAHGAFALDVAALEGLEASYQVRRHRVGGGRRDAITFGAPDAPGRYIRVVIHRPGAEHWPTGDALDLAAAAAAEARIDARLSGPLDQLVTKFGPLAIVDMHMWSTQGPRACMAAAGAWDEPRLSLVAWWCNERWELVQRGQVACLLDRLMLMSAGGDDTLARFFARAERGRESCGTSPLLGATPKRPDDWIFAKAEPKLRGRLGGR